MRIMGLDYGSKTVGVAVSDALGLTAQGIEIVRRKSENKLRQTLARIEEMAKETMVMLIQSLEAFVEKDLDKAQKVIAHDDVVDDLFEKVKKELIALIRVHADEGEQAVDLLMVTKYFERIGDHATNIAEWVIFSITGQIVASVSYTHLTLPTT